MSIYDRIADEYDTYRSTIGAQDLLDQVEALGDGLCATALPVEFQRRKK